MLFADYVGITDDSAAFRMRRINQTQSQDSLKFPVKVDYYHSFGG